MSKLYSVNVLYISDFLQQNGANSSKHQQGFVRVTDEVGKGRLLLNDHKYIQNALTTLMKMALGNPTSFQDHRKNGSLHSSS